jgi:hypothetical protein
MKKKRRQPQSRWHVPSREMYLTAYIVKSATRQFFKNCRGSEFGGGGGAFWLGVVLSRGENDGMVMDFFGLVRKGDLIKG